MSDRYFREKYFNMLLKMRVHPGDARRRLAWAVKELFFHRSTLRALDLSVADRKEVNELLSLMEADELNLRSHEKPTAIGKMRNATASRFIALLERLWSNHLESE